MRMSSWALHCLGVGDGWASTGRHHSAFLYRFGRTSFLMDCGEPVSHSYKATGLSYDRLDRILISHLHCDHIGGFFMLMQGIWLEQRKEDLTIHLPAGAVATVRQMLHAAFIFDELFPFKLRFEPWKGGQPVSISNVRVTPFPNTHLETLRAAFEHKYPQSFESYSFLLEAGRRRIGHSADIGAPQDLAPLLEQPLDLLVCELAHFRPEDLFAYLRGRRIKRLLLVHLGRQYWERRAQIQRLGKKMLPDMAVAIAKDGQVITVD